MERVSGIALVQVLIISVVLIMLSVFIGQTLKAQINVTKDIQAVHNLRLKLESAEALVFNALLSNENYTATSNENPIVRDWNFYNQPFKIEGITVQIQDLSGLYSLNTFDRAKLVLLLEGLGVEAAKINIFIDSLQDWTDEDNETRSQGAEFSYYQNEELVGPRNGYLQSVDEVKYIRGSEILSPQEWAAFFTAELTPLFNPMNAPEIIIATLTENDGIAKRVAEKRNEIGLTKSLFTEMTGIEQDGFIMFVNSNRFKVLLNGVEGDVNLQKSFIIDLKRRDIHKPLTITDLVWNKK